MNDNGVTNQTQQPTVQTPVTQTPVQNGQVPAVPSPQATPGASTTAATPPPAATPVKPGTPAATPGAPVDASMAVVKRDIENVVSSWTGIPISKLTEDESAKLLQLEDRIHQRLIDQEEAVLKVSEAVRRGRIGLASGQRPIASFIFLGPSGTGKTELAKTLAEILFGRDDAMIRLDMSEYMEKHEVAKLIGAPPGYVGYEEGGQLTEAVRAKPYSIVLLDEVEKAHPDVFNILLQLLEDGRLTDNKGNTISFKNTIVICTSNIGSGLITQKLSQQDTKVLKTPEQFAKDFSELSTMVNEELRKFFRPELLNRFDDIVIFKPLRREDMVGIAKLGIEKTAKLLKEQGYAVQITDRALANLAKEGYDPMYGARPLRRLVQGSIENPVALEIIGKRFLAGDTIRIDYDKDKNVFTFVKPGQSAGASSHVPVSPTGAGMSKQTTTVPPGGNPEQQPQQGSSVTLNQLYGPTQAPAPQSAVSTFDPMSVAGIDQSQSQAPATVASPGGQATVAPMFQQSPLSPLSPPPMPPTPNGGATMSMGGGQQMAPTRVSTMVNEIPEESYITGFQAEEQKIE